MKICTPCPNIKKISSQHIAIIGTQQQQDDMIYMETSGKNYANIPSPLGLAQGNIKPISITHKISKYKQATSLDLRISFDRKTQLLSNLVAAIY